MPKKTEKPTDKILAKAKRILKEREKQSKRIETCLQAGICPNCGEPGEPKRRNDNAIFRFICQYCGARYLKKFTANNEWKELLVLAKTKSKK